MRSILSRTRAAAWVVAPLRVGVAAAARMLSPVRVVEREAWRCPEGVIFLPGGTFTMGSPESDTDANDDARPPHEVAISPFCIERTEVTVAAWRACVSAGACEPPEAHVETRGEWRFFCNWNREGAERHPINCVTQPQSERYCAWRFPRGGSLPSEDQWEFAARGREGRRYPWGNAPEPAPQNTNLCGAECESYAADHGAQIGGHLEGWTDPWPLTAPVDELPHAGDTPEGISGMAGNVWEWTRTPWGRYTPRAGNATEYTAIDHDSRAVRGAGWNDHAPSRARAAFRGWLDTTSRRVFIGFRCVVSGVMGRALSGPHHVVAEGASHRR